MAQSKMVEVSDRDELIVRHDPEREEELTFYWKIAHFKDLYTAAKSSGTKDICRFRFTAGKSIGMLSNWEFHLQVQISTEIGDGLASELKYLGSSPCGATYNVQCAKEADGEYEPLILTRDAIWYPKQQNSELFGTLEELQQGGYLSNDELQLKLSICLTVEKTRMSVAEVQLKKDLAWDFKNMLESGLGADVTFNFVEGEGSENIIAKKKAHRFVLSARSPAFATMFGSGIKEATDGEVKIDDITPKAFGILLKFLYSGDVDGEWKSVVEELFCAADKYELKVLQNYLCRNIDSALTARNVWSIRKLASLHKVPRVLKSTMKFIKENMEDVVQNVHDVVLKKKSGA